MDHHCSPSDRAHNGHAVGLFGYPSSYGILPAAPAERKPPARVRDRRSHPEPRLASPAPMDNRTSGNGGPGRLAGGSRPPNRRRGEQPALGMRDQRPGERIRSRCHATPRRTFRQKWRPHRQTPEQGMRDQAEPGGGSKGLRNQGPTDMESRPAYGDQTYRTHSVHRQPQSGLHRARRPPNRAGDAI
jgi:hypothetical protein